MPHKKDLLKMHYGIGDLYLIIGCIILRRLKARIHGATLHATISGVDTPCNLAIARNIALCIRASTT